MAYVGEVHRWDLFWVDFEPHVGSEQGGERRPALVVSNDGFNRHFDVVTVVPLTRREGKKRKVYPFEVLFPKEIVGSGFESIAMPQQIRTISKHRLLDRIASLDSEDLRSQVENRLLEHLDIEFESEQFQGIVNPE